MPMKSKAQRAYLWSQHPDVAREFEDATPKGKKLPEHVKKAYQMGNGQPVQLPGRPAAPAAQARPAPAPQMAQQQPHLRTPGSVPQQALTQQTDANLKTKQQNDVAAVQAMQAKTACARLRLGVLTKLALAHR